MARVAHAPFGMTGRLLAPAITMWLSGALCLLCCVAVCAAQTPACETATESSCCAKSCELAEAEPEVEPSAALSAESFTGRSQCCPMFGRRPTIEGPQRQPKSVDAIEAPRVVATTMVPEPEDVRYASTMPVRSRGDTHLRCCVFRI